MLACGVAKWATQAALAEGSKESQYESETEVQGV